MNYYNNIVPFEIALKAKNAGCHLPFDDGEECYATSAKLILHDTVSKVVPDKTLTYGERFTNNYDDEKIGTYIRAYTYSEILDFILENAYHIKMECVGRKNWKPTVEYIDGAKDWEVTACNGCPGSTLDSMGIFGYRFESITDAFTGALNKALDLIISNNNNRKHE